MNDILESCLQADPAATTSTLPGQPVTEESWPIEDDHLVRSLEKARIQISLYRYHP